MVVHVCMPYDLFSVGIMQSVVFESCVTLALRNLHYSIIEAYALILCVPHVCVTLF